MSSWHTGESVEKVVFFAFACTSSDELPFRTWLAVVRGGDDELCERVLRAIAAEIAREDEDSDEIELDEEE